MSNTLPEVTAAALQSSLATGTFSTRTVTYWGDKWTTFDALSKGAFPKVCQEENDAAGDLEDDPEVSPLVTATDEHAASSASTSSLESNAFRSDHLRRLVDGSLETRQIVDAPTRDHVAQMDTAEAFPGLAIPFIVDIPNVAFRTFRALVYYAYTGIIHFAPLRSIERSSEDENGPKASTLACSPKSMYRLADMYGLVELKELAADNIRSQLSERPKAALKELLSSFTARIAIKKDDFGGSERHHGSSRLIALQLRSMDHGREDAESSIPRHTATKKGKKEKKRLKRSNEQGDILDVLEPVLPVASTSRGDVLRAALLASASGRFFEDVKFYTFSRRARDGSVTTPLPVLANTSLLRKTSSYFDYLFANAGFAESALVDIDAPYPSKRPQVSIDYDYDSDSDLEDDGDDEDDAVVDVRAQANSEDRS
ncbi:hypothetical protein ACG7TL_004562 [Trametes sanguinea]